MEETTTVDISAVNEKIAQESAFIDLLILEMNKVIVGQKHMVERLLIGLLGQGHILLISANMARATDSTWSPLVSPAEYSDCGLINQI